MLSLPVDLAACPAHLKPFLWWSCYQARLRLQPLLWGCRTDQCSSLV